MGAPDILDALTHAGVSLTAEGSGLIVRPASRLTPDLRRQIADHRSELLSLAPRRQWRISVPGREPFATTCPQYATAAEIMAQWPTARIDPA